MNGKGKVGGRGAAVEQTLPAVHRYFEVSLYLMVATSVLTLVSTGKLDPVSTFLPLLLLGVKAIRYLRGKGPELTERTAKILTVGYFFFFPFDLWFISSGLAAGAPSPILYAALLAAIHLMLYAMFVRLYSARTTRDYLFLTMVSLATVLVSAILTVDTLFLGLFLVFLVLAVSTFVGLEMRRSAEGAVAPPLATGTPAARRLHRALSLTSASVAVSALLLGTAIFFILPRVTAGYMSGLNLQPTLISGFSDDVELGQIGTIKQNKAVVFRARVEGDPAQAADVRWRGVALTTFDGRRWYTEEQEATTVTPAALGWFNVGMWLPEITREQWDELRKLRMEERLRKETRPQARMRAVDYSVLLEPLATDTLFMITHGTSLRGRFAPGVETVHRRSRGTYLLVDDTGSITNPFHNFTRILYEGKSLVPVVPAELLRSHQIGYSDVVKRRYLQLPRLDPRIPELARQVTAEAPTAYDKAAAIEQHLRTRFGYTLDLSGTPPADPLAHFLFERRAGHCEYFAAAMTVMLRTLDIPARYVNGFLPGEYNDVGGDFIVRGSDAHSWVEVFFGEYGWIPFDPTPPADSIDRGWLGRLALYYDWFELAWSEWVINYDYTRQETLALAVRKASLEWSAWMRESWRSKRRAVVEQLKDWQTAWLDFARHSPGAAAASLALLVGLVVAVFRGRAVREFLGARLGLWSSRFAKDGRLSPRVATLLYQKMLHLLRRRGWPKRPGQTAQEFAAALGGTPVAGAVGEMTSLYQAARFGAAPVDPRRMGELLDAIRENLTRKNLSSN